MHGLRFIGGLGSIWLCMGIRCHLALFIPPQHLQSCLVQAKPDVAVKDTQNSNFQQHHKLHNDKSQSQPSIPPFLLHKHNQINSNSQSHVDEHPKQKFPEHRIVLSPNAVVQKNTVVVEIVNTSLASVTVISILRHLGHTPIAFGEFLFGLGVRRIFESWVRWVRKSQQEKIYDNKHQEDDTYPFEYIEDDKTKVNDLMQEIEVDHFYYKHQPYCEYLPAGQRVRPTVDCSILNFSFLGFLALFHSLKHLEFQYYRKKNSFIQSEFYLPSRA